jgi:hypothetical protein
LYERVVGLRLRISGNSQKLMQMGKNIAKAAREIVDDQQMLGMAQDLSVVELPDDPHCYVLVLYCTYFFVVHASLHGSTCW